MLDFDCDVACFDGDDRDADADDDVYDGDGGGGDCMVMLMMIYMTVMVMVMTMMVVACFHRAGNILPSASQQSDRLGNRDPHCKLQALKT